MKSANADAIFQDSYLAARDMHQTRFLSELAGKVFGTGESVPRFDAEEWRSSRLGPQPEFSKSLQEISIDGPRVVSIISTSVA
jgi:hypothetical protein